MTFDEYQEKSRKTALYRKDDKNFNYPITYVTLGLLGEAGEVAEKVKKAYRDNEGVIDDDRRADIRLELGDVLWYVTQICSELELTLDEVAQANIDKLYSRLDRGKLGGDGDNR
jgi:NTP pyrophosphatase (non-canonical NTP hydrolase)